jgi:hypothetical protein
VRCGLLVCADCRGARQCAVCHLERVAAVRRAERRARLTEFGRRAAVIALVAASGATGLGAAFLPDGPLCAGMATPAAVELHLVALPRDPQALEPASWNEPLTFRCYDGGDGVTCCVITPR